MPKDPQFEHISEIGRVKDLRNSKNGSDPYCPLITKHNRYREVAKLADAHPASLFTESGGVVCNASSTCRFESCPSRHKIPSAVVVWPKRYRLAARKVRAF